MRKEFEMSDQQDQEMREACRAPMYLVANGTEPSPEAFHRAVLDAWDKLGAEMGFVGSTARPVSGKSDRIFSAEAV